MAYVIGVRFKKAGKVYYFDPKDMEFNAGEGAIVETSRGVEFGEVVLQKREVEDKDIVKPLKTIIRKADEKDYARIRQNKEKETEALAVCKEKILKHNLDMKLISVEYAFDGSKVVFFFTAEGRVDFRELVKDLAAVFKTRIELRQIGVRDETKILGGLGPCGMAACCSVFLGDFQPVSIKMAKEQNLSLSPTKISGLCGRLMCCLNYEQKYYEELRSILPRAGSEVKTKDGTGNVVECNAIRQTVRVKVQIGPDEFDIREYPVQEVAIMRKPKRGREEPEVSRKEPEIPSKEDEALDELARE